MKDVCALELRCEREELGIATWPPDELYAVWPAAVVQMRGQ